MIIDWSPFWPGVARYLFDRRKTYGLDSLHAVPVERKRIPYRQPSQQLHEGLRTDFWHAIEEQDLPVGPSRIVEGLNVECLPLLVLEESLIYFLVHRFLNYLI